MNQIFIPLIIAYLLLPIVLLFMVLDLKKKVNHLLDGKNQIETSKPEQVEPELAQVTPVKNEPSQWDGLLHWLKTDWPMKAGAFLVLLGFGWLTTYAFMNNWIGPMGRIVMGIAGGIAILLWGEWQKKHSLVQGSVLVALGAGTLLVTTFAARNVYDFFTPSLALLFMGLVVVFVAYSSLRSKVHSLAVLGLLMGGLAPLLTNTADPSFVGLFSYLFVLCAGTLWVVALTGWTSLNNLALGIVALYSGLFTIDFHETRAQWMEIVSAFGFATLFFTSTTARILKNKRMDSADLISSLGNASLLLFWINESVPEEWKSLTLAGVMVIFFVAATLLLQKASGQKGLLVYGAIAFGYLVAATHIETRNDETLFVLIYTLEAVLLLLYAVRLLNDPRLIKYGSILFLPSVLFSVIGMSDRVWNDSIVHYESALLLVTGIVCLGISFYSNKKSLSTALPFYAAGTVLSMAWIWLSAHALIENGSMQVMVPLTLYTVLGIGLNFEGNLKNIQWMSKTGVFLIGVVILRLLAIDIWEMDISGKIVTFFVIGFLLVGTTLLTRKKLHS